jgi:hypothetical protein
VIGWTVTVKLAMVPVTIAAIHLHLDFTFLVTNRMLGRRGGIRLSVTYLPD